MRFIFVRFLCILAIAPSCMSVSPPPTPIASPSPREWPGGPQTSFPPGVSIVPSVNGDNMTVSAKSLQVSVGQDLQLDVVSTQPPTWRSLNPDRASVDNAGRVRALAPGPVKIVADLGTQRARVLLASVTNPLLGPLILVPPGIFVNSSSSDLRTWKLLNDEVEWKAYWATNAKGINTGSGPGPVPAPPAFDFETRSILVLTDGEFPFESPPVITHIDEKIFIVFTKIANHNATEPGGFRITDFLFGIPKTSAVLPVDVTHITYDD